MYIDGITGALKYTKIGWLPPNAIAISFYHTGNNPLGLVDPSPSYLSWPSTIGGSFFGYPWSLCPLGTTKQYQVFINGENFGTGGVSRPLNLRMIRTKLTMCSLQVSPRTRTTAPRATSLLSTPTPGSRNPALLLTTLLSLTPVTLALETTTRAARKCFAARTTTRGQAALFKESRACSLLSYIPSVIAPYRS